MSVLGDNFPAYKMTSISGRNKVGGGSHQPVMS